MTKSRIVVKMDAAEQSCNENSKNFPSISPSDGLNHICVFVFLICSFVKRGGCPSHKLEFVRGRFLQKLYFFVRLCVCAAVCVISGATQSFCFCGVEQNEYRVYAKTTLSLVFVAPPSGQVCSQKRCMRK